MVCPSILNAAICPSIRSATGIISSPRFTITNTFVPSVFRNAAISSLSVYLLYAIRTAYASRATLEELARDSLETIKGFWEDWVLEPLRGIARTVRAGRDDGVIVTKESVRADLDVSSGPTDRACTPQKLTVNYGNLVARADDARAGAG